MNKAQPLQQLKTKKAAADRAAVKATRTWAERAAINAAHACNAAGRSKYRLKQCHIPRWDGKWDGNDYILDHQLECARICAVAYKRFALDSLADLTIARAFMRFCLNDVNDANAVDAAWADLDAPLNAVIAAGAKIYGAVDDARDRDGNALKPEDAAYKELERAMQAACEAVWDVNTFITTYNDEDVDPAIRNADIHCVFYECVDISCGAFETFYYAVHNARATARDAINAAYDAWVNLAAALNAIEDTEAHVAEYVARTAAQNALNVAVDAWADFAAARAAKAACPRPSSWDSPTKISEADLAAYCQERAFEDTANGLFPTRARAQARAELAFIKAEKVEAAREAARKEAARNAAVDAWNAVTNTYNKTLATARDADRAAACAVAAADDAADTCDPARVTARARAVRKVTAMAEAEAKAKAEADDNLPF